MFQQITAWLKAAWLKIVKSSTMWLAGALGVAPQVLTEGNLQYVHDNWPTLEPYMPHILQAKGLGWIAVLIFLCRFRSMVKRVTPQGSS